jgi:uncharacterized membrane protein (UPF0127 family)
LPHIFKKQNNLFANYRVVAILSLVVMAAAAYWLFYNSSTVVAGNINNPKQQISGRTDLGEFTLSIELAATESERSKGLMHRTEMNRGHGMLFRFDKTRMVQMWMKNTPLSLDMVFIDELGQVKHIARNTIPQSTKIISSRSPVRYVLEINAGIAEELGIKRGQRLIHPWFKTDKQ